MTTTKNEIPPFLPAFWKYSQKILKNSENYQDQIPEISKNGPYNIALFFNLELGIIDINAYICYIRASDIEIELEIARTF